MGSALERAWPLLVSALAVVVAAVSAAHVVLHKRDNRSALLWVSLILLTPFLGALLYYLLGINRVRRRAQTLRASIARVRTVPSVRPITPAHQDELLPPRLRHLALLQRVVETVVRRPLVPGNLVQPLRNGDEAFPRMRDAIDGAERSVSLSTYIFDSDPVGTAFVDRLASAARRGVEVRILVDDAGARYSLPSIVRALRRAGLPHARFHPRPLLLPRGTLNLRNHRKLCVVDGRTGFIGGMNLRRGHVLADPGRHPVRDVHFEVRGPVVAQIQEVFAEDWAFTTGENLAGDAWFPQLEAAGNGFARGIADGPDEDRNKLRWTLLGAAASARRSLRIVTPYFLPDADLTSALNVAAMRGVEVDIVLPYRSNIVLVHWAMQATLWQVLRHGCRVWSTPPPFDHAKLMVVDGHWCLVGSANWDPRSLRLNFEFDLECYDAALAAEVDRMIDERIASARPVTLQEVDARPLPVRLRDGVARLCTPLL